MYRAGINDIPYEELWREGLRGLIFDIDNTLVPFDVPEPTEPVIELFAGVRGMGFKVCLLSNNSGERVTAFNGRLNAFAVHKALKPRLKGLKRALNMMGVSAGETALIGDQLFTDILCGNRCGLYTILVKPVSDRDEFTVRLKRGTERLFMRRYFKGRDSGL